MSRRREVEIQFGSDSFLDVVANIVGILIILIVIAGVRVGQAPPPLKNDSKLPGAPPILVDIPDPIPEDAAANQPILADVMVEPDPEIPAEPLAPLEPPRELVLQAEQLESEAAELTLKFRNAGESLIANNRRMAELEDKLQTARALLQERKAQVQESADKDVQHQHDLELSRQAVARLQAQVVQAEKKTPHVEQLQHRITPVSRTVQGREIHFRVENNRVAEVPVDALVERLKEHIERRKDWIARARQHKGQVGPIDGFTMDYLIAVETISGMEELRTGMSGYRMGLRYWEIHPDESLRAETDVVALKQGSRFYQALVSASPETTLTFWVYPDSFAVYRKLQQFAHDKGFPVAGRPLPSGVAISGSPNGTRSSSQ